MDFRNIITRHLKELQLKHSDPYHRARRVKVLNQLEKDFFDNQKEELDLLLLEDLRYREIAMARLLHLAQDPRDRYFQKYV